MRLRALAVAVALSFPAPASADEFTVTAACWPVFAVDTTTQRTVVSLVVQVSATRADAVPFVFGNCHVLAPDGTRVYAVPAAGVGEAVGAGATALDGVGYRVCAYGRVQWLRYLGESAIFEGACQSLGG